METYTHRFTVFTPAYNRAYIIENLYHSLQRQKFRDFEWLVVDDGSTDGTKQLFDRILKEDNPFEIRYIKQENGGKHRAINRGVQEARGELFFIVDSDDYITDGALETADSVEKSISAEEKKNFAGICGQKGFSQEKKIGNTFTGDYLDITSLQRVQYGIDGDKSEIFYTDIMRKYPFPEFEEEKFLTECIVWNRIAEDGFKLRFFQDTLMICNYLEDGLTAEGQNVLFYKNPRGYGLYIAQQRKYEKWTVRKRLDLYCDYYYRFRDRFTMREMAQYLHCNYLVFMTGIRCVQGYMFLFDR